MPATQTAPIVAAHLIEGNETPSISGETFETVDPSTGQPLGTVAFAQVDDVNRAVDSAANAFGDGRWYHLPPAERARRMRRVATLLEGNRDRLAELESRDSGAPLAKTRGDVSAAAALFDYFAQLPEHVSGRTYATEPGYLLYSSRVPYGVVGAIAPWNFPLLLACWKTAPALAVGNSVVLKMAEQTPLSTSEFGRICLEAGIPPGVINIVHGDGAVTGAALAAHPQVRKVTFTGSTDVGRRILHAAADSIKSVHLELGGKSPSIVFADADLEQALDGTLFTTFFNSGQVCTSGSRILVDEAVIDDFRAELVRRAKELRVGNPLDESTQLGPLVSRTQHERVQGYIATGQDEGATVLAGGAAKTVPGFEGGYFVEPTIFDGVAPWMRIAQEEIFGPVATLIPFSNEDEAVKIANDVMYGLAATVWTTNLGRAMRMADHLESGIVWTNCPNHGQWNVPYEGHKLSGLGEDKGLESIETFTQLKTHHVNFGGHRTALG
jgi:acyl-CoA reductase-like NAD-dependent aldehyde dehydrogenase